MALDLKAIHEKVAAQIKASPISDAFNVYAFSEPGGQTPKIEVLPGDEYVDYHGTFGPDGQADVMLMLRVQLEGLTGNDRALWAWRLTSAGNDAGGTDLPMSLHDVIHADRTLGGVVDDAVVLSASWDDEAQLIRAPLRVIARKSGAQA